MPDLVRFSDLPWQELGEHARQKQMTCRGQSVRLLELHLADDLEAFALEGQADHHAHHVRVVDDEYPFHALPTPFEVRRSLGIWMGATVP